MIALLALAVAASDPPRRPPVIAAPGATVENPSLPGDRTPETTVPDRDAQRREPQASAPLPNAIATDPGRPLLPPPTAAPDLRLPPPY